MEFAFANKEIRSICEDENIAKEQIGESLAKILQARLADLYAASTVLDIPIGQPIALSVKKNYECKINLCDEYRLVFCVNHIKIPFLEEDVVDWSKVSRIKIMKIEK